MPKTSAYRGVSWNASTAKWLAQVRFREKLHYLGSFAEEVDASAAVVRFKIENRLVKPDGSVPTVLEAFKYEDGRLVCLFNSAKHSVGDIVGSSQEEGYVRIRYAQKTYLVHRLIWEMRNGGIPPDREIDHINGDAQDNRIENLRLVTRKENARNIGLQRRNRTGVSGVSVSNGLYRVTIGAEFVGHFDTLSEATRVRKDAEKRLGYHENHGRKRQ